MKRHFKNAAYGVLDYACYPLGMLLAAPVVLHRLGAAEYGLWMIATAVVSTGGILASGFCDANIQRVARLRGTTDEGTIALTVRAMMGITLALGCVIGGLVAIAAPFAARRIVAGHPAGWRECVIALLIAAGMILVRAVESVCLSTQRAFEEYGKGTRVNTAVRWITLGTAAALAAAGHAVVSILITTGVFLVLGTALQIRTARTLLKGASLWPSFSVKESRALLTAGVFPWIQALGGVIFTQVDRILLGVSAGAAAVAPYALCVQFAQPIHGLTASGLQFLFPYLSRRAGNSSPASLRRTLAMAFALNALVVVCGAVGLLLVGKLLMIAWAGATVALQAAKILPLVVVGTSLMGLSVTGVYALCAFGDFRSAAVISLGSRGALLLLMAILVQRGGVMGLAACRVVYGITSLAVYLPLMRRLEVTEASSAAGVRQEQEIAPL
jgi:O-antigen/teichoic acid export membrane protein